MAHALRYGARRDQNEARIIKALQSVGATVDELPGGEGRPDLLVGFRGRNYLMEVKTKHGKLNAKQCAYHAAWAGDVSVVRNIDEALRVIEVMA